MNDVLDWVLYARDEVHNVTTVYVNQYLKAQRVLDPGRLPTASILLKIENNPNLEPRNGAVLRCFRVGDRTFETLKSG